MKGRRVFLGAAAIFALWITAELFFSVREAESSLAVLRLNGVAEDEGWRPEGDPADPPGSRAITQGPFATPSDFFLPERELGYRLRPNLRGLPGRRRLRAQTLYDTKYSTDPFGWRRSVGAPSGRDDALFFGGGGLFGIGLPEEETLPSAFSASLRGAARSHNFGVPGWGAGEARRLVEAGGERPELVHAVPAEAFFLLTPAELERSPLAGSAGPGLCALSAVCDWASRYWRKAGSGEVPVGEVAEELGKLRDLLVARYRIGLTVVFWNFGDSRLDSIERELAAKRVDVVRAKSAVADPPAASRASPQAPELKLLAGYLVERIKKR